MDAEDLGKRFVGAVSFLAQLAFAIACLASIGWTILTRSLGDFLLYGGPIALFGVLAFGVISIVATSLRYEGVDDRWWAKPRIISSMILFVAVCSLLGAVVYYSVAVAIKDSYVWVTGLVLTRQSVIAVAIGTFAVGGVLYVIRYHFRCIFGLTEIVVGVSIGTFKISSDTEINAEFYFVLLTAAIYLVVRGLDNFQQGLTKDPKDKLMKWLLKESQPILATPSGDSIGHRSHANGESR